MKRNALPFLIGLVLGVAFAWAYWAPPEDKSLRIWFDDRGQPVRCENRSGYVVTNLTFQTIVP